MKLRTLIASFATLAGVTTAQAAVDATGIEPTLAISFNDKTLASTGSVTMKSNGWKIRTVANKDGETIANYTVELFKSGIAIIFK